MVCVFSEIAPLHTNKNIRGTDRSSFVSPGFPGLPSMPQAVYPDNNH